jgi:transcriptional regulator with XRE-family HTH domain
MGERVIRKLENGEQRLKPQTLRELANALGFPYSWFTVDDIRKHLTPDAVDPRFAQFELDFNRRLRALEERLGPPDPNGDGDQPSESDLPPKRARRSPRTTRPGRAQRS